MRLGMVSIPSQLGSLLLGVIAWALLKQPTVSIPSQLGSLLLDSHGAHYADYIQVSIPSQLGSLLLGIGQSGVCRVTTVSIPSQLGSLLLGTATNLNTAGKLCLNTLTVGQPLVGRRSLCMGQMFAPRLNTLTVGQPLVGATPAPATATPGSLNTLTVGQPLVGQPIKQLRLTSQVSIPSQLGSLLLGVNAPKQVDFTLSQYPHSWAASCWPT